MFGLTPEQFVRLELVRTLIEAKVSPSDLARAVTEMERFVLDAPSNEKAR